ncbi:MAG: DUF2723 domain-containing protein [Gemmatimonadota bacterium]
MTGTSIERRRVGPVPIWGWAAATAGLMWALYVLTLAPTTGFWDTSEYITTAHILGIPHPPGNPLFVILGRVWDVALSWTGLPVAVRINLLSATVSAAASFFWFLAMARILAHFTADPKRVVLAAFVSVLLGATAFTVWSQSNLNEKVYTVSLLFVALVTYVAMLWEDETGTTRGDRLLLLIAFLLGLGASNHTMSLLPLPAMGVFLLWHDWRTVLRWRLVSGALLLAALGFSVQVLFVPIRSAQNPIIDEADAECQSLVSAAVTPLEVLPVVRAFVPDSAVCEPLRASLAREQYAKAPLSERQAPLSAQFVNWWQYFDWQWARTLPRVPRAIVTVIFLFLGLVGLWRHWKGDRDSFVYFAVLLGTVTVALIFYLNFKYGYSIYLEIPNDLHEVRERDYFYIIGFNLWGLYAGLGLFSLWRLISEEPPGRASWPLLSLSLVPLVFNFSLADRRGDYAARDWAYNVLQSVEPYGVLFTNGDNDTFPLWYLQEVEGVRRDVTVIVQSYLGTDWYPRQLRDLTRPCAAEEDPAARPTVILCQRPFDAAAAPPLYGHLAGKPPGKAILDLTDEEIRGIPPAIVLPSDTTFQVSEWVQARARGNDALLFPDLLVLVITRSALPDRPVYFAATAPPVYSRWGLEPHLLRQGLAHKLVDGPLESTADTVWVGSALDVPWIDRARTEQLLWEVFQVAYLEEWEWWPEPSTRASIPAQYYLAYAALGLADEILEMPEESERAFQRAEKLLDLSQRSP